ncbi:MAG: tetratricopeptide repeat protein [Bdellovibrio sp.]|nr:tetratricopeptide repeat protein [Bdellovibrio sp.]
MNPAQESNLQIGLTEKLEYNGEKVGKEVVDVLVNYLHNEEIPGAEIGALSVHDLGRAFYRIGKVYYDKADLEKARQCFENAIVHSERPRDLYGLFKIYGFLIRICSEQVQTELAEKYIRESELVIDQLTSVLGSLGAEYFYNVGLTKTYRGAFRDARGQFELACKKSKEENGPDLLAKTLLALASTCYYQKEYDLALGYLDQLEQVLSIIDKSYLKASMLLYYGRIYVELGQMERAMDYYSQSLVKFQEKRCWNSLGHVLLGMGSLCKRLGEYEKSLVYFSLSQQMTCSRDFKRLQRLIRSEIEDVHDASIDIYLDRTNRQIVEKGLGTIDFKHRFVLLEILFLLAKNPGQYFDKEQLAKSIWKDEYNPLIHDKLIYTSVSRLRKLIEPKNGKGEKRKYIIRGKDGYTFNPRVKIRFHIENRAEEAGPIGNVDLTSPV